VRTRHMAVNPLVEDIAGRGTGARMERFFVEAVPLAKQAIGDALSASCLEPGDVGMLAVVSCTGYGNPGLDVRLARDLGMPVDLRRLVIGHMGCYAAIPGLATVGDYVRANDRPAVLLCAELTSLHAQPPPHDAEQVVAHALFADACAAAVVAPARGVPGLEILDVRTVTDAAASAEMTWQITDTGFRMGLSANVPSIVSRHVETVVERLLASHELSSADVHHWVVHPGGPRIIDVVQQQLELTDQQVAVSRKVLRDNGNCSSTTILLVVEQLRPAPGDHIVALAFGPGLTVAGALLKAST
jgi:predicted naringenin-chalcone synthase